MALKHTASSVVLHASSTPRPTHVLHVAHADEPGTALYAPVVQAVHTVDEVAINTVLYSPAPQAVHAGAAMYNVL